MENFTNLDKYLTDLDENKIEKMKYYYNFNLNLIKNKLNKKNNSLIYKVIDYEKIKINDYIVKQFYVEFIFLFFSGHHHSSLMVGTSLLEYMSKRLYMKLEGLDKYPNKTWEKILITLNDKYNNTKYKDFFKDLNNLRKTVRNPYQHLNFKEIIDNSYSTYEQKIERGMPVITDKKIKLDFEYFSAEKTIGGHNLIETLMSSFFIRETSDTFLYVNIFIVEFFIENNEQIINPKPNK